MAASDENLIDFSTDSPRKTSISDQSFDKMPPTTSSSTSISQNVPLNQDIIATSSPSPIVSKQAQTGTTSSKPNKSFFEITRVEKHGESTGFDDSELDDTLSETHDTSSTSLLTENSSKSKPDNTVKTDSETNLTKSLTVETSNHTSAASSTSSTPAAGTTPSGQPHTEPTSRFRIVKIAKAKAYDKGKWNISDFSDSQRKDDSSSVSENPASPMTKRTRGTTETSDRNITSPTEPRKTKSSEFSVQNVLSTSQSRGSSYNTSTQDNRRRSSQENTVVVDSTQVPPIVAPVVSALETALDQIQTIKDAMLQSVNEEMKSLRDNADSLQAENLQLKEENQKLRSLLENIERQKSIDPHAFNPPDS